VGLISGLDIEGLVGRLLEIEARPRDTLVQRIEGLTARQTAFLGLQAQVLAVRLGAINFNDDAVFEQKTATSSNEDALTLSTSRFSTPGTYKFQVKRLASNHQLVSNTFSARTSNVGSGTMSFEIGQGQLSRPTDLSFINGQKGFDRGGLEIVDRAGNSARIDVSAALNMKDVINAINTNRDIDVTARVSGDHLIIEDTSGGTENLFILGASAESLGVATGDAGVALDTVTGQNLLAITSDTRLSLLNDGNGVDLLEDITFTKGSGTGAVDLFTTDFRDTLFEVIGEPTQATRLAALNSGGGVRLGTIRVTDQNGLDTEIDLSTLAPDATLAELRDFIQAEAAAGGLDIAFAFNGRDNIQVTDNSVGGEERRSNFIIEDVDGFAAADLGILTGPEGEKGSNIFGEQIYRMESLGDVVNAINNHYGNNGQINVAIAADGLGLQVDDLSGVAGSLIIDSRTAEDLGIFTSGASGAVAGRRLIAGLNTVMLRSLNGGDGADPGQRIENGGSISLVDRSGNGATLDLTDAFTVQDVLDRINEAQDLFGLNISASLNAAGNGIELTDTSGGTGNLTVSGDLADKLGLAVDDAVTTTDSGNLQLQYISESLRLEDLRQGQGVQAGEFSIVNSLGQTTTVDIANDETLGDVIRTINSAGTTRGIEARINSTGDGIVILDNSGGTGTLEIKDVDGGTTAADLQLAGTARSGETFIDGSYEFKLEVGGGDNLEDIVSRVNASSTGVQASIIDLGGGNFSLSFNSEVSGSVGKIFLDGGTTNVVTRTAVEGEDALLLSNSLLIRSSSNSVTDVVKGSTLELHSVSDEDIEVTVENDVDGIVAQMQNFVEAYNTAMETIDTLTRFDPDTLERGLLFSDSTVSNIKRQLQQMVQGVVPGGGEFNQLSDVGVTFSRLSTESGVDANGNAITLAVATTPKLSFDETAFRDAVGTDLDAVADLFTRADVGLGDVIGDRLERLAGQTSGTIKNQVDALSSRQDLFERRIEFLDEQLARKETRLFNQFFAMEQALANLQSQQSALTSLSGLATQTAGR
jgi:flagellar hook-associated protein 2